MIVRDFIRENGKFIKNETKKKRVSFYTGGISDLIYKIRRLEPPKL